MTTFEAIDVDGSGPAVRVREHHGVCAVGIQTERRGALPGANDELILRWYGADGGELVTR